MPLLVCLEVQGVQVIFIRHAVYRFVADHRNLSRLTRTTLV